MRYDYRETRIGLIRIGYEGEALCELDRVEEQTDKAEESAFSREVFRQLEEYLHGERKEFALAVEAKGTPFQKKVWQALCEIPYGETRSYQEIAARVGNEKACRAVGMANHRNPVGIVVPCHRVIGKNGKLTGYAGGVDMKEALLALEKKYKETEGK